MRVRAALAAVGLVLAGCSGAGDPSVSPSVDPSEDSAGGATSGAARSSAVPTTAPSPAWLDEVDGYVGGYLAAVAEGSVDALGWFAPGAGVHFEPFDIDTLGELEQWLRDRASFRASDPDPPFEVRHVFVGSDRVVAAVEHEGEGHAPALWTLIDLGVGSEGITSHLEDAMAGNVFFDRLSEPAVYARSVEAGDAGWGTAGAAAAVQGVTWLYDHYPVLVGLEPDFPGVDGLAYAPDAVSVDSLRGARENQADGDEETLWPAGWRLRPAVLTGEPAAWPALTVARPEVTPAGDGAVASVDRAIGWYEADTGDGCERLALVAWSLVGGFPDPPRITNESVLWDVAGLRSCGVPGGGAVPTGWWDTVAEPVPLEERVTASYRAPDDSAADPGSEAVALANTDAELESLVGWAMGQFRAAGLDEPRPARIAFEPARACTADAGISGQVETAPEGRVAVVCFHAGDGDTELARWFLLHELAHVWAMEQLDESDRSAFVAAAGLDAWDGVSVPYDDRGIEAAANVLAWALLGGRVEPSERLGRWTCDEVVALATSLTGHDPLSNCPG